AQVKIALRNALITEAADDAAAVAGSNKAHSDCIRKDLTARGYTDNDMAALPYCVKHDWPDPFTSLGTCVESQPSRGRAEKVVAHIAGFEYRRAPSRSAPLPSSVASFDSLVKSVSLALT